MASAYSLPGVKKKTTPADKILNPSQSKAPVYQGPTKPSTNEQDFRSTGSSRSSSSGSRGSSSPSTVPGVIEDNTITNKLGISSTPVTPPTVVKTQKTKLLESYKSTLEKARTSASSLQSYSLKKLAPLTSSNSSLRLMQQYQNKSSAYSAESKEYETSAQAFNRLYGDKELNEADYAKAQDESSKLSSRYAKLEKDYVELEAIEKKQREESVKTGVPRGRTKKDWERTELKETLGLNFIAQGLYGAASIPSSLLSIGKPREKTTTSQEIKNLISSIPTQAVLGGISKGASATTRALTKPVKVEIITPAKTEIAAVTRIKSFDTPQGKLSNARVNLAATTTAQEARVLTRLDLAANTLEKLRTNILKIPPVKSGRVVSSKPKASGAASFDIKMLNDKILTDVNFLSKTYKGQTRFNRLEGGMSNTFKAELLKNANRDAKELGRSLAEARYGTPNLGTFGKNRMISFGFQQSKEIARLRPSRRVTGDFGGIKVSQVRPVVKPTPSGKTIQRSNIASMLEEIKVSNPNLKLYRETFVGKDVTYPNLRRSPFQVKGVVIAETIGNKVSKSSGSLTGNAASPTTQMSQLQIQKILQALNPVKGAAAAKVIKGIKSAPTPRSILKAEQAAFNQVTPKSLFYGTGQYERTQESYRAAPRSPMFSYSLSSPKPSFIFMSNVGQAQTQVQRQSVFSNTRTRQYSRTADLTVSIPKEALKDLTLERTKQNQRSTTAQMFRQLQRPITKQRMLTPPRISRGFKSKLSPFVFGMPRVKGMGKSKGLEQGYQVFTKRKGQENVLPGVFGRGEALKVLSAKLLSSLVARGGIRKTSTRVAKSPFSDYTLSKTIFRPYKIKQRKAVPLVDEFIQRRSKRLVSPLEIEEIKRSKRRKK